MPPPTLMHVLLIGALWWCAIVLHFLVCGMLAYSIGNPVHLSGWLKTLDEILQSGLSAFLSLLLLVVWWAVVGLLFAVVAFIVFVVDSPLQRWFPRGEGVEASAAYWQALAALGPVLGIALLSLMILPADAPNHYDSEPGLETAESLTYAGFVEFQFLSLFALLVIFVLLGSVFGGAAVIAEYLPNSGIPTLLGLILLSITIAITLGMTLGPVYAELPKQYGLYQATALVFAGMTVVLSLPTLILLRASKKK